MEAKIYDSNNAPIAQGVSWDCNAGQGPIATVPCGSVRTAVTLAKDAEQNVILIGRKSSAQVDTARQTNAGAPECFAFVPSFQAD
jgi:hypothetical protein